MHDDIFYSKNSVILFAYFRKAFIFAGVITKQ